MLWVDSEETLDHRMMLDEEAIPFSPAVFYFVEISVSLNLLVMILFIKGIELKAFS